MRQFYHQMWQQLKSVYMIQWRDMNTTSLCITTYHVITQHIVRLWQHLHLVSISARLLLRYFLSLSLGLCSADKKYFQIQFGPIDYCLNWGVSWLLHFKGMFNCKRGIPSEYWVLFPYSYRLKRLVVLRLSCSLI